MDNAVWQEVQADQLVTAALNQMGKLMCLALPTLVIQAWTQHARKTSRMLLIRTMLATKRLKTSTADGLQPPVFKITWTESSYAPLNTPGAAPGRFCNNTHSGYDVSDTAGVQECIDICNANPNECGGFAFFPDNSLGSNCIDHGSDASSGFEAKDGAGACYFRNSSWVNEGFPKPGVTCYKKAGKGTKSGKGSKASKAPYKSFKASKALKTS